MAVFNVMQGGKTGYELVEPPTVTVGSYTYNGSAQGPTIVYASDTQNKMVTTDATKIAAGTYTLRFSILNSNKYVWSDGTTADKTYTYTIAKQQLSVPSVTNTSKTYNGNSQGPTIASYDTNLISVANSGSNVTSATNAGTYHVVFSLVDSDNYKWSSGAVTTIDWSIAKASCGMSISPTSLTFTSTTAKTITVTRTGGGSVTASSSNTGIATTSVSGTTVTVTPTGTSGTATITINVAATDNYLGDSKTASVTGDFLKIVTWAGGTAAEIKAMLDAHYAGSIDITNGNYWKVGDTRNVTINGESHQLVIMNVGGKTLTTPINGKSTCAFVVGLKNCMNGTQTVGNAWTSSASWSSQNNIRIWCNGTFKGYIDGVLPNVFKQFKTITGISSSSNETVDDYFALPAEKEVFGSRTYSFEAEANALSQFTWYATSGNRVKTVNGSADIWWERSPYYANYNGWCSVVSGGGANYYGYSNSFGVSPFGCI